MYVCMYIYICIHAREHAQNYNTHVFSGGVNIGFQSQPHRGHTRSHDLPNQERASKLLSLDDWFGPLHGSWHFWWILRSSVLTIAPLNLDPKMNKRTLFHLARFEGHVYSWGKRITKQVLSKDISFQPGRNLDWKIENTWSHQQRLVSTSCTSSRSSGYYNILRKIAINQSILRCFAKLLRPKISEFLFKFVPSFKTNFRNPLIDVELRLQNGSAPWLPLSEKGRSNQQYTYIYNYIYNIYI